jgi:hypothetical protein
MDRSKGLNLLLSPQECEMGFPRPDVCDYFWLLRLKFGMTRNAVVDGASFSRLLDARLGSI